MKYIMLMISSLFLASCSLFLSFEEPKMQIIKENLDKNIAVRAYDPAVIMSVEMPKSDDDNMTDGFMILLDYISGENADGKKIAMTAPVLREFKENSQIISFFAPKGFTSETLPKPNNDKIIISKWTPENPFATITFSGRWTQENFSEQHVILKDYIQKNKLHSENTTYYAYYNDPMTLWFLRKNEILIQIKK